MKFLNILIIMMLVGCGTESPEDTPPGQRDYSFCEYIVDGICVMEENRFVDIDIEMLSWSLSITEQHVNSFYPGLNLADLSKQEKLKLYYRWANISTKYKGTYNDLDTTATVYLRDGENITRRMKCIDRYHVAMHEVLHFLNSRYIMSDPTTDYEHMVPYIFTRWEMQQSVNEGRRYDWTNTAEGLIYYDISMKCGYD